MAHHNKISPTAWLVAKIRNDFSEIPYSKQIAEEMIQYINPPFIRLAYRIMKYVAQKRPHKIVELVMGESRYLCIEDCLPADGDYFLVELAAGLSARGINHAKQGHSVLETDLPEILSTKKKILSALYQSEKRPDNHHMLAVNVLEPSDMKQVGEFYKKHGKNKALIVVHEGLTGYFTDEEKEIFQKNITALLQEYAPGRGHWITTDYNPMPAKKKSKALLFIQKTVQKVSKRKVNIHGNMEEVKQYFDQCNLEFEVIPNQHIVENLYTLKKMGITAKELPEWLLNYRAFRIKPSGVV